MTVKTTRQEDNVKMIFSLISLFSMLVPLTSGDESYYRTLFIFLINRAIDLFFRKEDDSLFFIIWNMINELIGIFACSLAFCMMTSEFVKMMGGYALVISSLLYFSSVSFVAKDVVCLLTASVKIHKVELEIRKDFKKEMK